MLRLIICVIFAGIGGWYGYELGQSNAKNKIAEDKLYCNAPAPVDCSGYSAVIEEWIQENEKTEDMWLQCQKDLARTQEELHYDIMCTTGECLP